MVGTFCGDLSYILANLVTSPIDLPYTELVERQRVAGVPPSIEQITKSLEMVFRNKAPDHIASLRVVSTPLDTNWRRGGGATPLTMRNLLLDGRSFGPHRPYQFH